MHPYIERMAKEAQEKTGWPPGLLQDDDKGLSRWFASKPDARRIVRQVGEEIRAAFPMPKGEA